MMTLSPIMLWPSVKYADVSKYYQVYRVKKEGVLWLVGLERKKKCLAALAVNAGLCLKQ